jgi:hypothetical protein
MPFVSFDGAGGDTWSFDTLVGGRIRPRTCDIGLLHTSTGTTRAKLDRDRFVAVVHLHNGANTVRAQCWWQGALLGQSETQNWNVKADDLPRGELAWSGVFGRPEASMPRPERCPPSERLRCFPAMAQAARR